MAKGTHGRSGPPPDPNALRRDKDGASWITLPAEGRQGAPPPWPLADQTEREAVLWGIEWARPQAIEWERNGQELEVGMYVRSFALAELPTAPTNARTLVRQQQEALGISLPGLHRNHWKIEATSDEQESAPSHPVTSARDRFKVVDGSAAGG